ncbi:MAG: nodulation protein NfeD [Betaproteobacteria bacterium]|nr:nodulation protein NfeD [Betaproteobacteria bacterium]
MVMVRLLAGLLLAFVVGAAHAAGPVVVLEIQGAIGPASADYLERSLASAVEREASLIVIEIDTPGGLDTSMRHMIKNILASPIPVAMYVAPSGARAASAGVYMLYASHIAAMAPGTNLGAATPVEIGMTPRPSQPADEPRKGDGKADESDGKDSGKADESNAKGSRKAIPRNEDSMRAKQVNDAAAYLRGLAQMRGRNAEWAERAVRESVSLSAEEAVREDVVDLMARDRTELIAQLDGRSVSVAGTERTLQTKDAAVVELKSDWRTRLLAIITNPTVAMILMLIGVYGILFEFYSPGFVAPGVIGAISLLTGLLALHLLPIDYAGLALMLLGIGFMVAEAFLPSFGILGIGGVVAFVFGGILLIDTDAPGFGLPIAAVIGAAAGSFAIIAAIGMLAARARTRPVVSGREHMLGAIGVVLDTGTAQTFARVQGEMWQVQSSAPLAAGERVRVTDIDGLTLTVVPDQPGARRA